MTRYRTVDHEYKGYLLGYSDYRGGWTIEPTFLYKKYTNEPEDCLEDLAITIRDELPEFKSLNKAKSFINSKDVEIKEKVRRCLVCGK